MSEDYRFWIYSWSLLAGVVIVLGVTFAVVSRLNTRDALRLGYEETTVQGTSGIHWQKSK